MMNWKKRQLLVGYRLPMTGNDVFQTVSSMAIMGKYLNVDNLTKEDNLKNKDKLKMKMISKMKMTLKLR